MTDIDLIQKAVKQFADQGVRWIALRRTQFYSLDKLINMAGK
jgi:hypothetical protein